MSLPATRVIDYSHLATPPEHLGVLVEPAPAHAWLASAASCAHAPASAPLLDADTAAVRRALRQRFELASPLFVCGHQPEFFHAGVLAKLIAAHALAERSAGQALFLTVDSDLPKAARVSLPQVTTAGLRRIDVVIPACDSHQSYEHQPRAGRAEWLQFFASLTSLHDFGPRSLLPTFARAWLTTDDPTPPYCLAFARAQSAATTALGLARIRELRVSQLCATPAFRAFAAHLVLHAERCVEAYNAAQRAYRQRHRVRTVGRPVPPLSVRDSRFELPLWAVSPDGIRHRLFVSNRGGAAVLCAENQEIGALQRTVAGRLSAHEEPWPLEQAGWALRPRAITLSAFARLLVADLFIHGIGGAKYDELTEDFARAFFGLELGPLACVSATLCLPLAHSGVRLADIAAARHRSRDLRFNPQRHLRDLPAELVRRRSELIRRAEELRAHHAADHDERRLIFRETRRLNEQLLALDPWRAAEYDQHVQTLEAQWRVDRIARDREYFYALHPESSLHELVAALRAAL